MDAVSGASAADQVALVTRAMSVADLKDPDLLAVLRAAQRVAGWAAAVQMDLVGELATRRTGPAEAALQRAVVSGDSGAERVALRRVEMAHRGVVEEVALELALSRMLASRLVSSAQSLPSQLPMTLAAMRQGVVEPRKVQVLADGLLPITEHTVRAALEAHLVPLARSSNVPGLREAVKKAVLAAQPEEAAAAAQRARADRRVAFTPADDDMIELWASLPAEAGLRLKGLLNAAAEAAKVPGDGRSADQRRADCLVDCVELAVTGTTTSATGSIAGAGERPPAAGRSGGVVSEVVLTVPFATVMGDADLPGYLAGYGPVTATLAREMAWEVAASGSWRCAVVDGRHGTLLGLGASTFSPRYEPPVRLRRHVATRDQRCRWAGCRAAAVTCDLDHRDEWPEGATCECNGESLCGHHHRVKHETGFSVRVSEDPADPPGTVIWTTPAGRDYPDAPPALAPPASASQLSLSGISGTSEGREGDEGGVTAEDWAAVDLDVTDRHFSTDTFRARIGLPPRQGRPATPVDPGDPPF